MGLSVGSSFMRGMRDSSFSLWAGSVRPPSMVAMAGFCMSALPRRSAMATNCGFCNTALPVLGASLYWTYHPVNGTADVAFRTPQSAAGWVALGGQHGSERPGSMAGSSVFIASQDGNGAVSVLMTYLESAAPSLTINALKLAVPAGPAAEYSGGAYKMDFVNQYQIISPFVLFSRGYPE
ncbi:cytochrome b561 and DOMON domain-containing protein [Panicum miliaceum]|uniref:Cytochrome b561 and DOMON domain-containing protein n=1 Tax=Panicum miliaceum TaxID=4540 RepID=A0A3L6SA18_PANMI|nr:cytochrome b561 and DOMON domain-containing protein [Panicum miliaceum]